ncbi:RNA-binding domain-containing protein [Acrodontium crateriforme]|uniref:RNA-binding domain-containing protein n=1 Tax=Acrodontium crateriforme TaxID=150365 RepID=A0AAQ3M545_9PEZI|nr:RNA-binding domain-containing protein [Acrodontium crateriforme]
MADPDMDEDLFADLYDGEDVEPSPAAKQAPAPAPEPAKLEMQSEIAAPEPAPAAVSASEEAKPEMNATSYDMSSMQGIHGGQPSQNDGGFDYNGGNSFNDNDDRPLIGSKEDGKMFIGGLNWETTDQSLKDYFSQFGEVVECTVMRDGATGRSRGFGFLTFKDPKNVNTVMVKEHQLDGKLIDPKRAIPREEQERTAKIFVGGVSQEATEHDFKTFFMKFGRVLDATLMMDKDTGRPRGFGFVTFDSEAAVDRTLEGPLAIHNKPIEVKRAQPRGNMREENATRGNKFGQGRQDGFNNNNNFGGNQQEQMSQDPSSGNNMSPAMMAAYWQRMQQYFAMMQQRMAAGNMGAAGMQQNPAMMQQMMASQGMNPAMMQQMAAMQNGGGAGAGGFQGPQQTGSPVGNNGMQNHPGFNAQEQQMFEQQKYERQSIQVGGGNNMSGGSQDFSGQNTWDGMYDDVPAPASMQGGNNNNNNFRGGFAGRGRGGGRTPQPSGQAPANAPTGPKNAGRPGGGYRGGGRGGHRGFHPYARGGAS